MVQIAGKYQLTNNENLAEYLTCLGFDAAKAKEAAREFPITTFTVEGDKVTIHSANKEPLTLVYVLNQEIDDKLASIVAKTKTTLEGDTLTLTTTFQEILSTRVYKFTDNGLTLTMSVNKPGAPVAVRTYRRV